MKQEPYKGSNLIFIISQPRAGSTLLQRILTANMDVPTVPEPRIILHPMYALKRSGLTAEYNAQLARERLDDFHMQNTERESIYIDGIQFLASKLYNGVLEVYNKKFFLDTTPRYHYVIPELYRIFSEAKFIILLYNPLEVLASSLVTWYENDPESFLRGNNLDDVYLAPSLIIEDINELQENAIVIHYEDLVTRPFEVISQICYRIGISFHEDMLEYDNHPSPQGRFGDSIGVQKYVRPVPNYIENGQKL